MSIEEIPPFREFSGWVKQLEQPEYSIDARVMETAFPGFFEDAAIDESARTALENRLAEAGGRIDAWEHPYRYRRFAGGSSLPRGKYFTLCTETGDDQQTLVRELLAYVNVAQSGDVYAYDLSSTADAQIYAAKLWYGRYRQSPLSEDEIVVSFKSRPGVPSPISKVILSDANDLKSMPADLPMFLRSSTTHASFTKVIDLRFPEVQQWVHQSLCRGIPHTLFGYKSGYRADLAVRTDAALGRGLDVQRVEEIVKAPRKVKEAVYYPTRGRQESEVVDSGLPDDFFGLLSYLIFPFRGGSPVTEVIGRWLRGIGTEALIYPSARSDVVCEFKDGRLVRSSGWDLVDYRDAPPPDDRIRLVTNAREWQFMPPDAHLSAAPIGSAYYNSFSLKGIAAYQDEYLRVQVRNYYAATGA